MARPVLITSRAESGPRLRIVIVPSPAASRTRSAASTAIWSNWLITGGLPGAGMTCFAASSTLKARAGVSGSGTCLTQQTMFIGIFVLR